MGTLIGGAQAPWRVYHQTFLDFKCSTLGGNAKVPLEPSGWDKSPDSFKWSGLIGGGHCDWSIPKRGCLIGGDLWHTLINWGGRIQRIQKTMASDKKGLSNWGGIFNPVSTLYILYIYWNFPCNLRNSQHEVTRWLAIGSSFPWKFFNRTPWSPWGLGHPRHGHQPAGGSTTDTWRAWKWEMTAPPKDGSICSDVKCTSMSSFHHHHDNSQSIQSVNCFIVCASLFVINNQMLSLASRWLPWRGSSRFFQHMEYTPFNYTNCQDTSSYIV